MPDMILYVGAPAWLEYIAHKTMYDQKRDTFKTHSSHTHMYINNNVLYGREADMCAIFLQILNSINLFFIFPRAVKEENVKMLFVG